MEAVLNQFKARSGTGFTSFIIGVSMLGIYAFGLALVAGVWIFEKLIGSGNPGTGAAIVGMGFSLVYVIALIANIFGAILGIVAALHPRGPNQDRFGLAGVAMNILPPVLLCLLIQL